MAHASPHTRRSLSTELDAAFLEVENTKSATAYLMGIGAEHSGLIFILQPGETLIGRAADALLKIDEEGVSSRHAILTMKGKDCFINDIGSTNGSYVNHRRITQSTQLHPGDILQFGTTTLGFLTDAESEQQHSRALALLKPDASGSEQGAKESQSRQHLVSLVNSPRSVHRGQLPTLYEHHAESEALGASSSLDDAIDKISLGARFVKRYWKLLALASVVTATLAGATVAFMPPRATAEFEIFLRQEQATGTAQLFATRGTDFFAFAEKHFIHESLVGQTITQMGEDASPDTLSSFSNSLEFERSGRSTFRGSYKHRNAEYAKEFLAKHLHNFLESEIGKSINVLRSEANLLRRQYSDNEVQLRSHEGALKEFKSENLEALPEIAGRQMENRSRLHNQRDQLRASLERSKLELSLARRQLASEDAFVETKGEKARPYEERIVEVKTSLASARAQGLLRNHPDVERLHGEMKRLVQLRESTLREQTTELDKRANPEHKRLINRVASLAVAVTATKQELGLISTRLAGIKKIAQDMPEVEASVSDKLRLVEASKKLHDRLYEQLKAKELELEFERASVAARYDILEAPAALAVNPVRSAALRAGVGSIFGLALGLAIALLHWLKLYIEERNLRVRSDNY